MTAATVYATPLGYGGHRLVAVELVDLVQLARSAGHAGHVGREGERVVLEGMARAMAGSPALGLRIDAPSGTYAVLARAVDGVCGRAFAGPFAVLDEHLAVDVDARPARRLLECADVLYGSRPRRAALAAARVRRMLVDSPGCCVAAAPVDGPYRDSSWAAGDRVGPGSVIAGVGSALYGHGCRATGVGPADTGMFASCLHAWRAAGRPLHELTAARMTPIG
ncbi:hypothetical protein AB0I49_01515 [Streptomyces sp. NPDC050617]|uniref:hypothetical protein n=1 Tax=Streptomyces sp. NPDC050617 TaxID=3154628 RepID=UPI00342B5BD0